MQVSATTLGKEYGFTGEEMNRALLKLGFLKGSPCDYEPTEKAMEFVKETSHHRGPGGYSCYNQDWITRTFDDSIRDHLNITPEFKREVWTEVADARKARYAAQAAARAKADAEFLAKQAAEKAAELEAKQMAERAEHTANVLKKVGGAGLLFACGLAIGYGLYKGVPKIIVLIKEKRDQTQEKSNGGGEL